MIRQLIATSALIVATAPMLSMSAIAASSPKVTVFNQGGYVADYQINYVSGGKHQEIKVSSLKLGQKRTVTLPVDSHKIRVRGQMLTGLFWEPLREIFNQPATNGSCFKTFGTIFRGEWNNSCTADF
jgi:cytolysin (calcineurin-like family phosphatase)